MIHITQMYLAYYWYMGVRPRASKTFFMLKSIEQELYHAHNC